MARSIVGEPALVLFVIYFTDFSTGSVGDDFYVSCGTSILRYEGDNLTSVYIQDFARVVALEVDRTVGVLFWSDVSTSQRGIYKSKTDDFYAELMIKDVGIVNGIALDRIRRYVYWTDETRATVEVARYDGTDRAVLVASQTSLPRGILVVPSKMYLYWGDQGTGTIQRSRLNGQERTTVVNNTIWPNSIVWNSKDSSLFWVDGWTNIVMESDENGDAQTVFSDLSIIAKTSSLFGLTITNNHYIVTTVDGRVIFLTSNGKESRIADVVESSDDCSKVFSITSGALSGEKEFDPCSTAGKCHCTNLCFPSNQTEFQCACPSRGGLSLVNNTSCKVASNVLLYTSVNNGEIGYIDLNKPMQAQRSMIDRSEQPMGLAYDPVEQAVFYSDAKEKRIYRTSFDGSGKEILLGSDDGIGMVEDLAIDHVRHRLYFTNYGMFICNGSAFSWHKVEAIDLKSHHRYTVTHNTRKPHALTLDMKARLIYFADRSEKPDHDLLWRMTLTGSNQTKMGLNLTTQIKIHSMALTSSNGQASLFIVTHDPASSQSWVLYEISSLAAGKHQTSRRSDVPLTEVAFITAMGSLLFLNEPNSGSLWSFDKESGEVTVIRHKSDVTTILYTQPVLKQISTDSKECTASTSVCMDNCAQSDRTAISCLCPMGGLETFYTKTKLCEVPPISIVFADVDSIKTVGYANTSTAVPITAHTLYQQSSQGSNIVGLAYDEDTELLYFTDGNSGSIFMTDIRGKNRWLFFDSTQLQNSDGKPQIIDSITIDRVSIPKRLLWTSYSDGLLCAIDASGDNATYREILSGLDHPRAVIVDEYNELIYWSECGTNAAVRAASLNGDNATMIFQDGLLWPNALFLDPDTRHLYIADGKGGHIYQCDANQTGDWNCSRLKMAGPASHIFSMTYVQGSLYLTGWDTASVDRINLETEERRVVVDGLTRPTQIVRLKTRPAATECDGNDSNCGLPELQGQADTVRNLYLVVGITGGALGAVCLVMTLLLWKSRREWSLDCRGIRERSDHTSLVNNEQSSVPIISADMRGHGFDEHQF